MASVTELERASKLVDYTRTDLNRLFHRASTLGLPPAFMSRVQRSIADAESAHRLMDIYIQGEKDARVT